MRIALILGSIFFVIGLFTLPHYGINWDTINHLPRGQAYLHYLLTGKKDYSDLPKYFYDWNDKSQWYWQNPKSLAIDTDIPISKVPQRSMYQTGVADFNYFMATDGDGHPPLSDIISSAFNRILFGKLRLINDIDSYHVYGVLLASLLVILIFYWVSGLYGKVAGFISAISLAFYPLFFSEMHFNTEKDIPETVYWSFLFFCVWMGITKKNWKWILVAGVFFGLALGTKFNVLFAIFPLGIWILVYYLKNRSELLSRKTLKLCFSGLAAIIVGIIIFVGTWPYLWADPISRVLKVIGFYKGIGISSGSADSTYSIQWIIYSTPILALIFSCLGIFYSLFRLRKEKSLVSLLFLLWLITPIARVSWGHANTYGGVRQIMEYIPALAVMAGVGGSFLLNRILKIKNVKFKITYLFIVFGILLIPIFSTHPNENVYFNALVGGLSGAKARNFSYWGFSFGSAYRQGIEWINDHAEENANVVYAYELIPNIPRLWIRPDLSLSNSNRSGYLKRGEYAITLTYQGTDIRSYYDGYLENFLKPVYEAKVDRVGILKVWKNDEDHYINRGVEKIDKNIKATKNDAGIIFELDKIRKISRLEINYIDSKTCKPLIAGYLEISKDKNTWQRLPGVLPDDWRISYLGEQPKAGHFIEPFLGQEVKFIHLSLNPIDTCLMRMTNFTLYYFE